ncbi:glycosyltransferase [Microcella humidisoli]|uniref:Glycosyltransferase n=1 Tax=Microcella humidisoli TaxID=2963406 RepID=A0ABY5FV28_9MICO|nr:glycosyltransferase [Microcella humidisoli]UTT61923.1 glycosyltransferase [Microcella humidisoli]
MSSRRAVINVDVTDIIAVPYTTGIQRVTRELLIRLVRDERLQIRLLAFDLVNHDYAVIDPSWLSTEPDRSGGRDAVGIVGRLPLSSLGADDVFFDVDSVWSAYLGRPYLYKRLKRQGVTIVTTIYDFVPMKYPHHTHQQTIRNWMAFISAVFTYSDLVLPISRSAEKDFTEIRETLGIQRQIPSLVTRLGGDFKPKDSPTAQELDDISSFINKDYLLFVGTVEPRKRQLVALQAFQELARENPHLHMVFVGRKGWHSDDTADAITDHPLYGSRVHWLTQASDRLTDYLQRGAFAGVYLSDYEGYGLPVAESLARGVITVTSANSSMFEVGGPFAEYSMYNSAREVAGLLRPYLNDHALTAARRNQIAREFRATTWDTVTERVADSLATVSGGTAGAASIPSDFPYVLISNNLAKLESTIRAHNLFASCVSEYVVVCPTTMVEAVEAITSSHPVRAIDEEVLLGDDLPEFSNADHQRKNWMLRSRIPAIAGLGKVFIMLDDDSRPIRPYDRSTFVNDDGSHNAFYCRELPRWPHRESSYDMGQANTNDICLELGLEQLSYSAHQPQIIDRDLFADAVRLFEAHANGRSVDEWSAYFNFAIAKAPHRFRKRIFETLAWPAEPTDWSREYIPSRYTFHNAVDVEFVQSEEEGHDLAASTMARFEPYDRSQSALDSLSAVISENMLAPGASVFRGPDGTTVVVQGLVDVFPVSSGALVRLPVQVVALTSDDSPTIEIGYRSDSVASHFTTVRWNPVSGSVWSGLASVPVFAGEPGVNTLTWVVRLNGVEYAERTRARQVVFSDDDDLQTLVLAVLGSLSTKREGLDRIVRAERKRPGWRLRRAGKNVVKFLVPALVEERSRFHAVSTQVASIDRRLGLIEAMLADLVSREGLAKQASEIASETAAVRIANAALGDDLRMDQQVAPRDAEKP